MTKFELDSSFLNLNSEPCLTSLLTGWPGGNAPINLVLRENILLCYSVEEVLRLYPVTSLRVPKRSRRKHHFLNQMLATSVVRKISTKNEVWFMAENDEGIILVIEDEVMVQMLVVDVLKDLGFSTLEAKDSGTALPILQSAQAIDLLITDIGLPGMNGWDLAKLARETRPSLKILFLTGYESADEAFERNELQDIMVKPFDMGEFESKVTAMLGRAVVSGEV